MDLDKREGVAVAVEGNELGGFGIKLVRFDDKTRKNPSSFEKV